MEQDESRPRRSPVLRSETAVGREEHAVLAWLVCEADLPGAVAGHLLDALQAWVPLQGTRLFGVEPVGGDQDVEGLLRAAWSRLSYEADHASWQDRVVLVEVAGQIGLALAVLLIGDDDHSRCPLRLRCRVLATVALPVAGCSAARVPRRLLVGQERAVLGCAGLCRAAASPAWPARLRLARPVPAPRGAARGSGRVG